VDRKTDVYETPQSLVCSSGDGTIKIIFSPLSPADIRQIKSGKQNRLSQFAAHSPLLVLPKRVNVHEMSVLNGGHLFDLELAQAWKALTKQSIGDIERVWMYSI
jgi:hypothetical protein